MSSTFKRADRMSDRKPARSRLCFSSRSGRVDAPGAGQPLCMVWGTSLISFTVSDHSIRLLPMHPPSTAQTKSVHGAKPDRLQ